MYNDKQKKEFLDYIGKTDVGGTKVYGFERFFDIIAAKEEEYGKDLCKMSTAEAIDTMNISNKRTTVANYLSKARKYLDWCVTLDYCNFNRLHKAFAPTSLVFKETERKETNEYYISEEQCAQYIKKMLADPLCGIYGASVFYALYCGIGGYNNLAMLSTKDIDMENNIVTTSDGIAHQVPEKLIDMLLETSKTLAIPVKNGKMQMLTYEHTFGAVWNFVRDGKIDRQFRYIMENKIRVAADDYKLNMTAVINSGLFNYIKRRCCENGIDLKQDMTTNLKKLGNDYTCINEKYRPFFEEIGADINFTSFKYRFRQWVDFI